MKRRLNDRQRKANRRRYLERKKKNAPELTRDRLTQFLDFDCATGLFTWATTAPNKTPGAVAGTINHKGHRVINLDGTVYQCGRLVYLLCAGVWPEGDIIHENGDKADDTPDNLIDSPKKDTRHPVHVREDIGVRWNKQMKRWTASIGYHGVQKYLGGFHTKQEAIAARIAGEVKYGYPKRQED